MLRTAIEHKRDLLNLFRKVSSYLQCQTRFRGNKHPHSSTPHILFVIYIHVQTMQIVAPILAPRCTQIIELPRKGCYQQEVGFIIITEKSNGELLTFDKICLSHDMMTATLNNGSLKELHPHLSICYIASTFCFPSFGWESFMTWTPTGTGLVHTKPWQLQKTVIFWKERKSLYSSCIWICPKSLLQRFVLSCVF